MKDNQQPDPLFVPPPATPTQEGPLRLQRRRTVGVGWAWNHLPHDAEDFTGDRPIVERAAMLRHAEFF